MEDKTWTHSHAQKRPFLARYFFFFMKLLDYISRHFHMLDFDHFFSKFCASFAHFFDITLPICLTATNHSHAMCIGLP